MGGLAVALSRIAMAGDVGLEVDLSRVPVESDRQLRPDAILYSESQGRLVLTVAPEKEAGLRALFWGIPCACVGSVSEAKRVCIWVGRGAPYLEAAVETLRAAYKKTLDW